MKIMLLCPHEFDVALCGITLMNAALSFSLVGNSCPNAHDNRNM